MIRYLKKEEYGKCIPLWQEAFPEDSKKFTEYYFGKKLRGSRVLVKEEENGAVLAMAHLNPYKVMVRGHLYELPYIVGVATAAASRRQGHMRGILRKMLQDMYEDRTPFCYLMPVSRDIYRPFGFTCVFDQPLWKLGKEGKIAKRAGIRLDGECLEDRIQNREYLVQWMNRWLEARFEVYAVRSREYLDMLQAELDSEDGEVLGLFDYQGNLGGLQAVWGIGRREQRFLYCDREEWIEPGDEGRCGDAGRCGILEQSGRPSIMARITNAEAMAEAITVNDDCPCTRMEVFIRIHDSLVKGNDGLWRWNLGPDGSSLVREQEPDGPSLVCEQETDIHHDVPEIEDTLRSTEIMDISIDGLASWLFGYSGPDRVIAEEGGNLPFWTRYVRTLEGVFLDEVV